MHSTKVMTLTLESIDKFLNWSSARGQSLNTTKAYRSDLVLFLAETGEQSIQMSDFEDRAMYYLNSIRRTAAPRTTGRKLTAFRSFARWAGYPEILRDYVAPTPSKAVPHPIPEGMRGVEMMLERTRNAEQQALIGLCGFAGLRVSEALSCMTDWINLSDMLITVRGKGDKERIVPLSSKAWSAISTAMVNALSTDKKLIHYQDRSARKCITVLGEKAGLSRSIASHDLRATFATEVYNKTKDQRVVQELLGHANGSTTEVYIGVTHKAMKLAVEF